MKKTILMCVLAVTLVFAQASLADTVTFQAGFGPWTPELTALPGGDIAAYADRYSVYTRNQGGEGTFQTFCMETNEFIEPGVVYTAILNTAVIEGRVGPLGDELSQGSAWLYAQFAQGILPLYDFTNAFSRSASATDLQNTLWWLEGEIVWKPANVFTTAVETFFGNEVTAMLDNKTTGNYDVRVLNLYDATGAYKQDVLIYVPEPGTLMLLGLGLIGLVGIKRKF